MTPTLKAATESARNGEIHLGTVNGWTATTDALFNELKALSVPESSSSRNLGRCYNEYSFDSVIDGQTYRVLFTVDSGD